MVIYKRSRKDIYVNVVTVFSSQVISAVGSNVTSCHIANPSVEQVHVCKRRTVCSTFVNVDLLSSTLVNVDLLSSTFLNVEQICSTLG